MPKVVTFFLPQFHPVPENDAFWGKGFTDWINVARAKPQFEGHNQPDVPADLGFYDLRLVDTLRAQAELARQYGVHGFCFHYYWFAGRKLLNGPLENLLNNKDIDLPFCLNFANENWTRRWDGLDDEILIEQKHSDEDDRQFIRALLPYFRDERYIRIAGKPVLLVYKTFLLPDAAKTAKIWREEMAKSGIDLYLIKCESGRPNQPPGEIGFDAAVEFPPQCPSYKEGIDELIHLEKRDEYAISSAGELTKLSRSFNGKLIDYRLLANFFCRKELPPYPLFRCVMPGWDNTPRKKAESSIYLHSSPGHYRAWLSYVLNWTAVTRPPDEQIVFVNAWNEWGEGAHLEPCQKYGRAYLEATGNALSSFSSDGLQPPDFVAPLTPGDFSLVQQRARELVAKNGDGAESNGQAQDVAAVLAQEVCRLSEENRKLGQQIADLTSELHQVYTSRSWVLSEPLRKVNLMIKGSAK